MADNRTTLCRIGLGQTSFAPAPSTEPAARSGPSEADNRLPAAVLMLLSLLIGFMPLPADPDLWFHLADGEYILAHRQVPRLDPFSFTRQGEPWVPHSWLFDAVAALGWHHLGPRSTEALMALAFMLAVMLSFSILCRRGVTPLTAAVVCAGLAIAAGNTRGIRPQVLSLLLCNLVILLCLQHRRRPKPALLLAMPAIFLLWAQLHAACVMGLLAVAAWLAGRCLEALLETIRSRRGGNSFVPRPKDRSSKHCWPKELGLAAASLALSVVAVLLTPHAMTHFAYVKLTFGLEELHRTEEWQSPQAVPLRLPDVYLYVLVAVLLILLARCRRRRLGWAELSLSLATLTLAFTGVRHIPLFCIGCVPLLADLLAPRRPLTDPARPWPPRFLLGLACLAGAMLTAFWRYPSDIQTRYRQAEPVNGAQALAAMEKPLRVFTTYNTGSYILHAAPGRLQVFVDSRADVYGDKILAEARQARLGRGWQNLFDRWRIDAAVLERTAPLAAVLAKHAGWTLLAQDPVALTFFRTRADR